MGKKKNTKKTETPSDATESTEVQESTTDTIPTEENTSNGEPQTSTIAQEETKEEVFVDKKEEPQAPEPQKQSVENNAQKSTQEKEPKVIEIVEVKPTVVVDNSLQIALQEKVDA